MRPLKMLLRAVVLLGVALLARVAPPPPGMQQGKPGRVVSSLAGFPYVTCKSAISLSHWNGFFSSIQIWDSFPS
jgi:hypothetical protein